MTTTSNNPDPLLTLSEAAQYAGVSKYTLRRCISSGDLEAIKISPQLLRVRRSALERFLASGSTTPDAGTGQ